MTSGSPTTLTCLRAGVLIKASGADALPRKSQIPTRVLWEMLFNIYLGHGHPPPHFGIPSDIFCCNTTARIFVRTWAGWISWTGQIIKWPQEPHNHLAITSNHALHFSPRRGLTWCQPKAVWRDRRRWKANGNENVVPTTKEMIDTTSLFWRSKPDRAEGEEGRNDEHLVVDMAADMEAVEENDQQEDAEDTTEEEDGEGTEVDVKKPNTEKHAETREGEEEGTEDVQPHISLKEDDRKQASSRNVNRDVRKSRYVSVML